MLAAMRAAGVERLTERVDFPINIAVGDSLLHGKGAPGRQGEFNFGGDSGAWTYRTEEVDDYIKSCHIKQVSQGKAGSGIGRASRTGNGRTVTSSLGPSSKSTRFPMICRLGEAANWTLSPNCFPLPRPEAMTSRSGLG